MISYTPHNLTETSTPYSLKCCMCTIKFCNYKRLTISHFQNNVTFYTFVCYQSQSILTRHINTVGTTQYGLKECLCPVIFCNYSRLDIGLYPSSAAFCTFIYYESK